MKPEEILSHKELVGISKYYQEYVDSYLVKSSEILTEGQFLFKDKQYILTDFRNGNIYVSPIMLKSICLKGYTYTILAIDLRSGEYIKRSHRLGSPLASSNWIINDLYYFDEKPDSEVIQDYCEKD